MMVDVEELLVPVGLLVGMGLRVVLAVVSHFVGVVVDEAVGFRHEDSEFVVEGFGWLG
jgi:hypothetical protein